ncbi:hypothetical protein ACJJTC_018738 [Scirpophaga incertulas]
MPAAKRRRGKNNARPTQQQPQPAQPQPQSVPSQPQSVPSQPQQQSQKLVQQQPNREAKTQPKLATSVPAKKPIEKVTSFTANEKNMVINTYKHVKETWPKDKYPFKTEMAQKAASILGIGVASVYRILKDYNDHGEISSPVTAKPKLTFTDKIDDFTKSAIRKKVHAFFIKGELPSLKKAISTFRR